MLRYNTILWDVDQTLLDFDRSQAYALAHALAQYGITMDEKLLNRYDAINDSYWKRLEKQEITREEVLTGRFETLFAELGLSAMPIREFAEIYQKALGSVYYYRDDSLQLCRDLGKDKSLRQYVVTNGVTWTQRNKLTLAGFDQVMEAFFISEELGAPKPAAAFFDACFARIPDFERDRTLIVGDSPSSDIRGGNQARIACCWYNPGKRQRPEELRIDYEISNLWEIKDIIYG